MDKYEALIEVLNIIRNTVDSPDTDLCWSKYNDITEILKEIDFYIEGLEKGDYSILKDLRFFFAPTGCLQEISLSNGWGEKFIELSTIVDKFGFNR